jgi:hypothetical protein
MFDSIPVYLYNIPTKQYSFVSFIQLPNIDSIPFQSPKSFYDQHTQEQLETIQTAFIEIEWKSDISDILLQKIRIELTRNQQHPTFYSYEDDHSHVIQFFYQQLLLNDHTDLLYADCIYPHEKPLFFHLMNDNEDEDSIYDSEEETQEQETSEEETKNQETSEEETKNQETLEGETKNQETEYKTNSMIESIRKELLKKQQLCHEQLQECMMFAMMLEMAEAEANGQLPDSNATSDSNPTTDANPTSDSNYDTDSDTDTESDTESESNFIFELNPNPESKSDSNNDISTQR